MFKEIEQKLKTVQESTENIENLEHVFGDSAEQVELEVNSKFPENCVYPSMTWKDWITTDDPEIAKYGDPSYDLSGVYESMKNWVPDTVKFPEIPGLTIPGLEGVQKCMQCCWNSEGNGLCDSFGGWCCAWVCPPFLRCLKPCAIFTVSFCAVFFCITQGVIRCLDVSCFTCCDCYSACGKTSNLKRPGSTQYNAWSLCVSVVTVVER